MVKRYAYVSVRNNTSSPVHNVSVIHKYSDVYRSKEIWPTIQSEELAEDKMLVNYNTGFLTTGHDWWLIMWVNNEGNTLYYSHPHNFRDILDKIERLGNGILKSLSKLEGGESGQAMREAAQLILNQEGTAGFKQHMLESDDNDKLTEIVINSDYTITFKSHSGTSNTVTATKEL
ncbi:hypothetical protein ETB97_009472 [Aspergillus alliaceus]|uniref:Up-regulated in Daf-2 domain-containing protein n=1 Tax=Petromyces alliaceus TaxID=209559 RepID=A0A5N6FFZ9_PETAA|nr:uncharacterized protein BDW43DRAFT_316578 [Aspergillus alliaceus]KAB8227673.1 hypothetical protein BDW43DRAFT_316578 [Aspergillus alliaceus]KAE8388139.1 hypothetical protein BDV23DRAFT_159681 [Aspergillus alliaceus]KAF5855302.1 hypothetical protein ETB97_009472 [Aspergillus burnettii]